MNADKLYEENNDLRKQGTDKISQIQEAIAGRTRSKSRHQSEHAKTDMAAVKASTDSSHSTFEITSINEEAWGDETQQQLHNNDYDKGLNYQDEKLAASQNGSVINVEATRHHSQPTKGHVASVLSQYQQDNELEKEDAIEENTESSESDENSGTAAKNMTELSDLMKDLGTTTKSLNKSVQGLKGEITRLRNDYTSQENKVSQIEHTQTQETVKVQVMMAKLEEHEERINMLISTVVRQDETINALKNTIHHMQTSAMKQNVIVYNLEVPTSANKQEGARENVTWTIMAFLKTEMGIDETKIKIKKAFRMGKGEIKPILVSFSDENSRQVVLNNLDKLKGKVNSKGKAYFISEQLPEEIAENKRQNYYRKQQNKKLPEQHQVDLAIKQNQLFLGEDKFVLPVQPLTPSTWLRKTPTELEVIDQYPVISGEVQEKQHSFFASYACEVKTLDDVQKAYYKVRRMEPEATHVMCAYRLPGLDFVRLQSFLDDGEHGAGRQLLELLNEENVFNRAVFVVRYYGGTHLGPLRFKIILQVAKTALSELQMNIRHTTHDMQFGDTPMPIIDDFKVRHKHNALDSLTNKHRVASLTSVHQNSPCDDKPQAESDYLSVDSEEEGVSVKINPTRGYGKKTVRGGRGTASTRSRSSSYQRGKRGPKKHYYTSTPPAMNTAPVQHPPRKDVQKMKQPSIVQLLGVPIPTGS